jgi:hypothetical protein
MQTLSLSRKDYEFNNWYLFGIITGLYMLLTWYTGHYIVKDQLYYNSFGDQLAMDRIDDLISRQKSREWISYVATPLLLLLKIGYTTVCISLGGFIMGMEAPFKKVFKVALFAELAFLCGGILQNACLYLFSEINTLEDIQQFAPFSLYGIFGSKDTPAYLSYPLRVINLFEIGYWILLALGLKAILGKPFSKMLGFVLSSYGVGLLIWIVFIVFLSINLST